MIRCCLFAALLCAAGLVTAEKSFAAGPAYWNPGCCDNGYGAWGGRGWAGYGGYAYLAPRISFVPTPPYDALHPPVYYSAQFYRRPYGWSPYAMNGNSLPTEGVLVNRSASAPEPVLIMNPFVAQK